MAESAIPHPRVYKTAARIFRAGFEIQGFEVSGHEHIPVNEPYILAIAPHSAHLDVPMSVAAHTHQDGTIRPISFLTRSSVLHTMPFRPISEACGSIGLTDAGIDRSVFDAATSAIANGGVLGIFPQGKRLLIKAQNELGSDDLEVLHPGVLKIARRAGALVLPVGLATKSGWKGKKAVRYEKPLESDEIKADIAYYREFGDLPQLRSSLVRAINTAREYIK